MSEATAPPRMIDGLPFMGRDPVLVTGPAGTLGQAVVAELLASQVPTRVLVHHTELDDPDVEVVHGDLSTGDGIAQALDGVQAVVHCATAGRHPSVDVQMTRTVAEAAARAERAPRLVHMSILGCWDNPLPYYRAKADGETCVIAAGGPHAIVRATQFHPLVRTLCTPRAGLAIGLSSLRFAPCDPAWVAHTLVDVALAEDSPVVPLELGGPEVLSAQEIATLTAHISGRRLRRHVSLPAVGSTLRAFARGSNLPGPGARRGGATYAQWLAAQLDAD